MPRQIPQGVKTCTKEMGTHYDRMTACIQETIKDTAPPRRKQKFNGREVSAETKILRPENPQFCIWPRDHKRGQSSMEQDTEWCDKKGLRELGGKSSARNRRIRWKGGHASSASRGTDTVREVETHNDLTVAGWALETFCNHLSMGVFRSIWSVMRYFSGIVESA